MNTLVLIVAPIGIVWGVITLGLGLRHMDTGDIALGFLVLIINGFAFMVALAIRND